MGDSAAARFAGYLEFFNLYLGLTPQAVCLRPLRRLASWL
jgi:hypothetical protein